MSGLFHHSVIDQKEGFVFLVAPRDATSEYETELAKGLEEIIKEGWPSAPSQLTVAECNSEDEAELIYADIQTILEEAEEEEADNVVISSIVIVGDLCIVNCTLAGGDSEEEGDDSDEEEEEEDWE